MGRLLTCLNSLFLQAFQIDASQSMKRTDQPRLVEVAHGLKFVT